MMTSLTLRGAVALALLTGAAAPLSAQTLQQRIDRLEQENREQAAAIEEAQRTIAEQKQVLEGAPQRVQTLERALEDKEAVDDGWFRNIEIAGLIEVEAFYAEPFGGGDESDIVLATFELGIASQVTDWVEVAASLLYEEDDTDLEVDLAYVTIANPDVAPVFLTAGQIYVPFGAYETNLISDPLTLEIGETRETTVQLGFVYQGFAGSVYAFNGDNDIDGDSRIGSWGANLLYGQEREDITWTVGAGYISDLGDSDTLQDSVADNRSARLDELIESGDPLAGIFNSDPTERTGGWTANLAVIVNGFNLIGEYLTATDDFDADSLSFQDQGAKPSAWNIELGYAFEIFGKESVVAAAYQGTEEAVALELPKERWMLGLSVGIFDNTALSLEYAYDTDYDKDDGGTGDNANTVTAQLAVTF
jgi:uncharacterized coiled-coil protein SlyX